MTQKVLRPLFAILPGSSTVLKATCLSHSRISDVPRPAPPASTRLKLLQPAQRAALRVVLDDELCHLRLGERGRL